MENLSYGEKVVRMNFNASKSNSVDTIKSLVAQAINVFTAMERPVQTLQRQSVISPSEENVREAELKESEWNINMKKAIDNLELACMFAVKAVTS